MGDNTNHGALSRMSGGSGFIRCRIKTVSILLVLSPQRMSAERKQTPQVVENPGNGRKDKRGFG
jgi:hypothetical protein